MQNGKTVQLQNNDCERYFLYIYDEKKKKNLPNISVLLKEHEGYSVSYNICPRMILKSLCRYKNKFSELPLIHFVNLYGKSSFNSFFKNMNFSSTSIVIIFLNKPANRTEENTLLVHFLVRILGKIG